LPRQGEGYKTYVSESSPTSRSRQKPDAGALRCFDGINDCPAGGIPALTSVLGAPHLWTMSPGATTPARRATAAPDAGDKMKVSLVQLCSTRDVQDNLARCARLAEQAADDGADWILFPENAPFLGKDTEKLAVAEEIDGSMVDHFRDIARQCDAWVTLGSFPEVAQDAQRTHNTQVLVSPAGEIDAVYRKMHLFDVEIEGGQSYRESHSVAGGSELVTAEVAVGSKKWPVGLTICYDLRFPELYRGLLDRGVQILTVPSAFTLQTGRDHWHPLLQARAIENQCYVLAPNQWGNHFGPRSSYGHSAVYDPWGRMIACAPDAECVVTARIDADYLDQVRRNMPCLDHRRVPSMPAQTNEP
jgi:deaminated glutathione amidase